VTLGTGGQSAVSPFEILHSVVHLALGPYFDAYTKGQEAQNKGRSNKFVDAEAKTGKVARSGLREVPLDLETRC